MTALAKGRHTPTRANAGDRYYDIEVDTGQTIYPGALVMTVAGKARAAANTSTGLARGKSLDSAPRTAGEIVRVQDGTHAWVGTMTIANVGAIAYVTDDQTLTLTPNNVIAGVITDVDADGVWVDTSLATNVALGT
jgi:hypothetical protein